jgi:hypothetical protein
VEISNIEPQNRKEDHLKAKSGSKLSIIQTYDRYIPVFSKESRFDGKMSTNVFRWIHAKNSEQNPALAYGQEYSPENWGYAR